MNAPTTVPAVTEVKPALVAGVRPRAIVPTDIEQVWRVAGIMIKAGLNPRDFDTQEKCCVAIMHGLEVGLPPMMALQRIAVINGRPAVWGDAVPGIALATGQVEDWFESVQGEGDHMVATCRVKRKAIKTPTERTFSVADAKRAGLWDERLVVTRRRKDGSTYEAKNDSPWHRYPKRMLAMRARVAFRDLFADAFGGLYIAEELIGLTEDERATRARDVTPARPTVAGKPTALPPTVPPRSEVAADVAESPDDEIIEDGVQGEQQATPEPAKPAAAKKPLPPLAKGAKADGDGIPTFLLRNCPPADEREAFRAWIVDRLSTIKSAEDAQLLWDTYITPNLENEQILEPDRHDLLQLFAARRKEIDKR